MFHALEVGSVVYVHDWKNVDLAGVPLTKNGDVSYGQLILETQYDRILYIEIENPEDFENFGPILVRKATYQSKLYITNKKKTFFLLTQIQDRDDSTPTLLKETKFYSKSNSISIQFNPSKLRTDLSLRFKVGKVF